MQVADAYASNSAEGVNDRGPDDGTLKDLFSSQRLDEATVARIAANRAERKKEKLRDRPKRGRKANIPRASTKASNSGGDGDGDGGGSSSRGPRGGRGNAAVSARAGAGASADGGACAYEIEEID